MSADGVGGASAIDASSNEGRRSQGVTSAFCGCSGYQSTLTFGTFESLYLKALEEPMQLEAVEKHLGDGVERGRGVGARHCIGAGRRRYQSLGAALGPRA